MCGKPDTVKQLGHQPESRRNFIGGSDARIIMGRDEKAPISLWKEKRGEVGPEDLSANLIVQLGLLTEDLNRTWDERSTGHAITAPVSDSLPALLSQPDAGTATILFEELDSGLPECGLDLLSSVGTAAQKTILGFKSFDRGDRDISSCCQLLL
jgi:hypothetical protein